ncbi:MULTISPECIES: AMP-binding protein [unclassified Rhodococcus (in: high G+C Gram-positive bacteria)]|uniref:AMP-binding protein n=1 Tax=unclassified Rhodococcus (in: high G+C Gram-positive bacteria) TaxID=192944 RepID=UPI000BE313B5|nr:MULTISPECIES: AMP-binding protein [unclassified Rhodococcus (in: high G+C Gram-positive bacteria)]MBP1158225.1 hypothetical protein [Rhodococcus sp. PvR099]
MLEVEGIAASAADGPAYPTLGKPLSGMEVRVVDPDTRTPLAIRQVGEFELRGESITSGYLTARGSVAAQDADGWIQTGDLGCFTEEGETVICGRRKDVIIISGRNLYPTDIERATERVAGVRTANAIAATFAAGSPGEGFAVLAESAHHNDEAPTLQLRRAISTAVSKAVGIPPRTVTVLAPGTLPKPPPANCADPAPAHSLQRSIEPTRGAGHTEMVVYLHCPTLDRIRHSRGPRLRVVGDRPGKRLIGLWSQVLHCASSHADRCSARRHPVHIPPPSWTTWPTSLPRRVVIGLWQFRQWVGRAVGACASCLITRRSAFSVRASPRQTIPAITTPSATRGSSSPKQVPAVKAERAQARKMSRGHLS